MVTAKIITIIVLLREEGFLVTTEFMGFYGSHYMPGVIFEIKQINAFGFLPSNIGENGWFKRIIRMTGGYQPHCVVNLGYCEDVAAHQNNRRRRQGVSGAQVYLHGFLLDNRSHQGAHDVVRLHCGSGANTHG